MSLLDTPVRDAAWAALDFESAGAAPGRTDEPVQVGMAVWRAGELGDFFRSYIHAPVRVTPAARAVHGIGEEALLDAPAMTALWIRELAMLPLWSTQRMTRQGNRRVFRAKNRGSCSTSRCCARS
jgi:hypothetical protein